MCELVTAREVVAKRGNRLEYFTIARNSLEGLIGVAAGAFAGSISLVGFGIDSLIEVTSGATPLWRMSTDADVEMRERNERLSLRIVGACFLALSLYITYEGVSDLASKRAPERFQSSRGKDSTDSERGNAANSATLPGSSTQPKFSPNCNVWKVSKRLH